MSASGAELRRPGIAFCLAVLLAARFSHSAPVYDQDTTQVAEYNGGGNTCYYNYKHYQEGDRIITNEPCLNCTCHDRMLMCYLRVCPFTKAIGQDCTVEKRPDQCCPVITCPQVPVQLLTSTTSSPSSESTELGFRDNYGCNVNNLFYADGAQLPIDYHNPCELCYCIRNRTTCVMQECTLKVAGCKPIFQPGVCCPVKYDCDYDERAETTIGPSTPGLLMTTTITPGIAAECYYEGKSYEDGELIYSTKPCQHCYCFRGEIACAIQDCGTPMKTHGKNCTALPPPEGECCPTTYQCESDFDNEVTSMPEMTEGIFGSSEKPMSTLSPSKESETKTPISDESYPGADNTIPELQPVDELTTITQEIDEVTTMSSERPEKTTQVFSSSEKSAEDMTEVPQLEDRENVTEEDKEVTEEIESSTQSEEDKLTTLSPEEVPVVKEETSTVKDIFESSTSTLLVTEKDESNYTEKPESIDSYFPTEISQTEKSTDIPTEISTSSEGLEESSTSMGTSSEKPLSSEAPEQEVVVEKTETPMMTISPEDSTSELPGDSVDEESKTTESENEIPIETVDTSSEMGLTSSSSTEEDKPSEETTPFMLSTESNVYSTTKQDAELTTKVEKEEVTTRQPVTIPISDRMPEHKAEDKDAISEMPMTEPPAETELTPDITVTYLPPASTTAEEQASTTKSSVGTTELPKESESTLEPEEFHENDLTTIQSETVGEVDHTSISVPMSTERIPEKAFTESTVTEQETDVKETKTTHMLPSSESTDGMLASTPGIGAETTEESSKSPELELTTMTESNRSEEETSQTPDSYTTESKMDVGVNATKPSESVTVEESQTESATKPTFIDTGSTLSTEITGVDQAMTTEFSEEFSDKPETTATPITEKSTIDMKETERPSTDLPMTEEPINEMSSVETSSEGTVEETSTPISSETDTTIKIEYSTHGSTELPDSSTVKAEITQTDMSTSELTSAVPTESTIETDEQLSTSMKPTDESKNDTSEISPEDKVGVTPVISEISSPETSTTSQREETKSPELEDRFGMTEQTPESKTEEEVIKHVTISQQEKTPKPAMEGETVMPHVPKKEESDVEMSHIPDIVTPEMPTSMEVESSHTTESQTEGTSVVPPEMRPPIGIPGEGNCLVDGQSYSNNSAIPPANSCQIRCRCISSIVQCDLVQCTPPPSNREDCTPIHTSTECCPTYTCEAMPEIESDNHMIEHETPLPNMETVMPEVEKTTLKTIDEHSLITSSPGITETEYDKVTKAEELDKSTTIQDDDHSKLTTSVTESIVPSSTTTTKPDEYDTSELLDKSTESAELTTKLSTLGEEASTTASDSTTSENEKQTSVKPTDEFITEEQPLSTERQTEKPSDDELTVSSTDRTEGPTGGEEISVSSESTEKPTTESTEMEIEDETTEKLSTHLPSSTEKQMEFTEENSTPLSQTTAEKPENYETSAPKEYTVSSEEPGSTMSTVPEMSSSSESPKDETKYTTSSQLDNELTTIFSELSTSSSTELEKETTPADEIYSKKPESKPLDSTSEETTLSSEQEPTSSDVTKILDEIATTQPSISVEDKTSEILVDIHTTQEPDKILDENLVTSSINVTGSVTESDSETGVSSTSVPDRSTEISSEMTEETSSGTHAEEKTTVDIIENTSEPTDSTFSVEPTEEPVEKETKPTEQKTPEEATLTPTEEETFKPTSYPAGEISSTSEIPVTNVTFEITTAPELEISTEQPSTEKDTITIKDEIYVTSSSETPELPKEDSMTTIATSSSETPELPKEDSMTTIATSSSETPELPKEGIMTTIATSSSVTPELPKEDSMTTIATSSSETPELPKEDSMTTVATSSSETPELSKEDDITTIASVPEAATETTRPTTEISEEKEIPPEQTTVSSDEMSSSALPDSTEMTEEVTKENEMKETSSTETESETHPSTSPKDEMLEPTTSKEQLEGLLPTTSKEPVEETSSEMTTETKLPDEVPVEPEMTVPSTEIPEVPKTTLSPEKEVSEVASSMEPEVTDKSTESEASTKLPPISTESSSESSEEITPEEEVPIEGHLPEVPTMPEEGEDGTLEPDEHEFNHTMEADHSSTTAPHYTESASDGPENPSFPMNGGSYLNPDEDYDEDDQAIYGPGTCRYGGKVYMSAQQIPRDDPCDFCFCFRSDIICLQQSCPPPIPGCHEEPINGFCCPRYECHVSMAATLNLTTTTTTTTTTLPPHFLTHAYKGAAKRSGCIVGGQVYRVGEVIKSASGPCLQCTCGGDGNMNCNPRVCTPEPSYRQMIAHATAKRRR